MDELDTMFGFSSFQSNEAYKELDLTILNHRNPVCGDKLSMSVGIYTVGEKIFLNRIVSSQESCIVTRASLGYLQEVFPQSDIEAIKELSEEDYLSMIPLSFTAARYNCILLPFQALQFLLKSLILH